MERSRRQSPAPHRPDLRTAAVEVVRILTEAGHVAYFAGGCVRDRLLGLEPADYDVATDARPEAVGKLFRRSQHVGESFGVMLGPNPLMKTNCALLSFRDDLYVNFGSVIESRELERLFFSHIAQSGVRVSITERSSAP